MKNKKNVEGKWARGQQQQYRWVDNLQKNEWDSTWLGDYERKEQSTATNWEVAQNDDFDLIFIYTKSALYKSLLQNTKLSLIQNGDICLLYSTYTRHLHLLCIYLAHSGCHLFCIDELIITVQSFSPVTPILFTGCSVHHMNVGRAPIRISHHYHSMVHLAILQNKQAVTPVSEHYSCNLIQWSMHHQKKNDYFKMNSKLIDF